MFKILGASWVTARLARSVNPASPSWALAAIGIARYQYKTEKAQNKRLKSLLASPVICEIAAGDAQRAAALVETALPYALPLSASARSLFSVLAECPDPDPPPEWAAVEPGQQQVVLRDTQEWASVVGRPAGRRAARHGRS
jgi:hypothetical protein